jgi:hypothetical protein
MNRRFYLAALMLITTCALLLAQQSAQDSSEWKPVEDALGRKGSIQPGNVFKFAMPRSDLKVTVGSTPVKPGLALGSWVAFKKTGNEAIVMGDLVLLTSEVEPVMMKLQQLGIEQTAVHNHLLGESPRVMYMHIAAHGNAAKLASALKSALTLTKTPAAPPTPSAAEQSLGIDTAKIDQILGHKGKNNGGIYQISVPRAETITDMGTEIPPSMGTATSINFQPTGNGRAAITGDFVLIGSEVNPVIRALRDHGIEVTAVHSHMLTENPRLFFMHYWANSNAVQLAKGLRAALVKDNSAKGAK